MNTAFAAFQTSKSAALACASAAQSGIMAFLDKRKLIESERCYSTATGVAVALAGAGLIYFGADPLAVAKEIGLDSVGHFWRGRITKDSYFLNKLGCLAFQLFRIDNIFTHVAAADSLVPYGFNRADNANHWASTVSLVSLLKDDLMAAKRQA